MLCSVTTVVIEAHYVIGESGKDIVGKRRSSLLTIRLDMKQLKQLKQRLTATPSRWRLLLPFYHYCKLSSSLSMLQRKLLVDRASCPCAKGFNFFFYEGCTLLNPFGVRGISRFFFFFN